MLADWLAKAGFSYLVYSVALEQTLAVEYEYEEYEEVDEDAVAFN